MINVQLKNYYACDQMNFQRKTWILCILISACLYSQSLGVRCDNLKVIMVYMRLYVKQSPKILKRHNSII